MAKTLTLEGDIAAADTRTALTTQGSVTAPSVVVPAGVSKIDKIIVAAAAEGLADGSGVFFLRIGGNAVQRGEQAIMISAAGRIAAQAGSDAAPQVAPPIVIENADIAISPSDTLTISAEMAGSDLGTGHVVATILFA